jgi:transcriptional regulator with XRE-family HTH domain
MNDAAQSDPYETHYQDKWVFSQAVPEELLQVFIRNVQIHMVHQRLTDKTLAMAAGVSTKTVNNVLNKRHNNKIDKLIKIANGLKVEFWMLWIPETPTDPKLTGQFKRLLLTAPRLPLPFLKQINNNVEFLLNKDPADLSE